MKRFLTFIFTILLLIAFCGGLYLMNAGNKPSQESVEESESNTSGSEDIFDDYEKPSTGPDESTDEGNDEESGSTTTPELKELTIPTNSSEMTESGLMMLKGAALKLTDVERPELVFTCEVSKSLYEKQSNNLEIGILLAPLSYFEEVNTSSYTVIDWVTTFKKNNVQYLTQSSVYATQESSTGYMAKFSLTEIAYENINRKFAAIAYVKITNGSVVSYKYGEYETGNYREMSRSVAYVASAALSAQDQGKENISDAGVAKLKKYIMESRDYAHGLATPTYDEQYYDVHLSWFGIYGLNVGDSTKIDCYIKEDVEVPIQFISTDEKVFTIDSTGKLTATGEGTATLEVYVAGLYAEIDVEI